MRYSLLMVRLNACPVVPSRGKSMNAAQNCPPGQFASTVHAVLVVTLQRLPAVNDVLRSWRTAKEPNSSTSAAGVVTEPESTRLPVLVPPFGPPTAPLACTPENANTAMARALPEGPV